MAQAIGIDLGTTNSAVAVVRGTGKPEVLKNAEGDPTTPSVVLFQNFGDEDETQVGEMAKRQQAAFPDDVASFAKRYMGDSSWRFIPSSDTEYSAVEVSALILKRLKADAEQALGEDIKDAVITVPAYFDDARRAATKQAGEIAGLNVRRVLNEPTAAAISYGLESGNEGTALVYDLGGGTFDVTILRIGSDELDVLGTDGDRNLGGFDFDNELINLILDKLGEQGATGHEEDDQLAADLREKSEHAKKSLSTTENTNVMLNYDGKPFKVTISREEFENACRSLLTRTEELVQDCLDDAGLDWDDFDNVLLVGGSTRMPMVPKLIEAISGKKSALDIDPDQAVALGAAVQAAKTTLDEGGSIDTEDEESAEALQRAAKLSISDVTSQSLGVLARDPDTGQMKNSILIKRNTKIPASHSDSFSTVVDNQAHINLQVTQGDETDPEFVTVLGENELALPPNRPQDSPVRITFSYDIDQVIFVEVEDLVDNVSLGTFEVQRDNGLTDEDVQEATSKIQSIAIN